jgi:hypothetical protein
VAVTNWAAWYYVVSAVNGVGESGNSSEASAVPRPRPPLNASPSGNQLFLSWPGWATGYTAYSASNLLAPIQWQTVTNSPQSNNGWFNLTLPKTQDQRFFRLGAP